MASSVSAYGGELPETLDDMTALQPQNSYGAQKAMCELLINDYSRRALIDGRVLRLPTIVIRPGRPNAAASLRFEHQLTRLVMAIATVMLVISVTLSFYQVLTRFLFNAPSTWTEVASRASMIWCVFMAAAPTFRGGYMMAVEGHSQWPSVYQQLRRRRWHRAAIWWALG